MNILTIIFLLISSGFDLKSQRVPNILSLGFIGLALLWLVFHYKTVDLLEIIKSVSFVLLLTLPGYINNIFGAADVKVLLALSLFLPWQVMLFLLLGSFVIFIAYWALFYRPSKDAPFIPAVCGAFLLLLIASY